MGERDLLFNFVANFVEILRRIVAPPSSFPLLPYAPLPGLAFPLPIHLVILSTFSFRLE